MGGSRRFVGWLVRRIEGGLIFRGGGLPTGVGGLFFQWGWFVFRRWLLHRRLMLWWWLLHRRLMLWWWLLEWGMLRVISK
ncbi:unnamed protein product, partial [Vitis vinifera]